MRTEETAVYSLVFILQQSDGGGGICQGDCAEKDKLNALDP